MSVINTNVRSLVAQNAMSVNNRSLDKAMASLSTGSRINSAADDAAGLAISSKMTAQIRGLDQAVRNANDGISMLQTADGAMVEVTNMMQRMRELSVASSNDTNVSSDRTALTAEFSALSSEISRIGANTQWNGMNLLDGSKGAITFQVGANTNQNISTTIASIGTQAAATQVATLATTTAAGVQTSTAAITVPTVGNTTTLSIGTYKYSYTSTAADTVTSIATNLFNIIKADTTNMTAMGITATNATAGTVTLTGTANQMFSFSGATTGAGLAAAPSGVDTQAHANSSIADLDAAIATVNTSRGALGATINRLNYAADNLANVSQNASASRSRILDTDYAKATTELSRTQIIAQASTAMLAQANQSAQSVLALLK